METSLKYIRGGKVSYGQRTMLESATRRPSETAQAFTIRVTDPAERAYPTSYWKVTDDNFDPEKIYSGTAYRYPEDPQPKPFHKPINGSQNHFEDGPV